MNGAASQFNLAQPVSMRHRLQRVTLDLHRSVERHLALTGRSWTQISYRALLRRLWGIYAPLEQALMDIEWQGSGIAIGERRKLFWLEMDLSCLGLDREIISGLEICRDLPSIDNIARGLGALYVLEGSTLGGQVILRTLQPQIGITPHRGGRFFASYGKGVGEMWRSYLASLEHIGRSPEVADTIECAARDTFAAFDRWLAGMDQAHG